MVRKRSYRLTVKEQAILMKKALAKAREAGVPDDWLTPCRTADEVLYRIKDWTTSSEYLEDLYTRRRTEEHNELLRFIRWYLSWEEANEQEINYLQTIKPAIHSGANLTGLHAVKNLRDQLINRGHYDPEANLKRIKAPWKYNASR